MGSTNELSLLSLCTGYGGIERGLELAGVKARTVAHVEIEAYAIANLVAKMEQGDMVPAPVWTNLKTLPVEWARDRIDILTGGYPCQPFSSAGKRLGADDPRHLWPYITNIIRDVRPRVCFFENVEGHITKGLREVLEDLDGLGYKATWGIFSAEEAGAPHQRKRAFIMAHSSSERLEGSTRPGIQRGVEGSPVTSEVADATSKRGGQDYGVRESGQSDQAYAFPARPNEEQYDWEEPRTIEPKLGRATDGSDHRIDRLRLLGNGVVSQCAAVAWKTLAKELDLI